MPRPRKKITASQIYKYAEDCESIEELADKLECSPATFYRRLAEEAKNADEHPEVLRVLREAVNKSLHKNKRLAQNVIFYYIKKKNLKAAMYYLDRHGWAQTQKTEHSGTDGKPIEIEHKISITELSAEDRASFKEKILEYKEKKDYESLKKLLKGVNVNMA